jgi:hypothetical protein
MSLSKTVHFKMWSLALIPTSNSRIRSVSKMAGPMQYGVANDAGPEITELKSTATVTPGGTSPNAGNATLLVTNPGGGNGVQGWSWSGGTGDAGVVGIASGVNSNGVIGKAYSGTQSYGVWGIGRTGYAGVFTGTVHVYGGLIKTGGGFQIDYPGKETQSYLRHSFVESPDMKNLYDGMTTLDDNGGAWIGLPEWFRALNQDYRYQLTSVGQAAPDLHIAEEVERDGFRIAGGPPGSKVSWQVTGTRKDAWAEMNRIVVEEAKPQEMQGRYLHPEAFGRPDTQGEQYLREEKLSSPGETRNQMQAGEPGLSGEAPS